SAFKLNDSYNSDILIKGGSVLMISAFPFSDSKNFGKLPLSIPYNLECTPVRWAKKNCMLQGRSVLFLASIPSNGFHKYLGFHPQQNDKLTPFSMRNVHQPDNSFEL